MKCEICGKDAPYFSETYCPKMQKSRTIWLCGEHQNGLFLEIGKWLWMRKEDERKRSTIAYGVGNTPTFVAPPPTTYQISISDLKKCRDDKE